MRFNHSVKPIAGIRTILGKAPPGTENEKKPRQGWRAAVYFGRGSFFLHFGSEKRGFSTNEPLKDPSKGRKDNALEKKLRAVYVKNKEAYVQDYNRAAEAGICQNERILNVSQNPDWEKIKWMLLDPLVPSSKIERLIWLLATLILLFELFISGGTAWSALPFLVAALLMVGKDQIRALWAKRKELRLKKKYIAATEGNVEAMHAIFGMAIARIDWFQDSKMSYDILKGGKAFAIDVDLPEMDQLPSCKMRLVGKDRRIEGKNKDEKELRADYANAVCALSLRIGGTVFVLFPAVDCVDVTGYAPLPVENSTWRGGERPLISARFERSVWNEEKVKSSDAVAALSAFQHRTVFTNKGAAEPVEPFEPITA
ncbi:hypothetical protein FACS1894205_7300 [Alphaproteobacteria bacterium]|nr:hypothetical protein FACS1894205_7300 [Alphaproteobacteria bacterium]